MKVSEFIAQMDGLEDFEIEIILQDKTQEGTFPSYDVFEMIVEDIGYSAKLVRLGIGAERN